MFQINKTELAKFLIEAKKNTYATQKGKVDSSRKALKLLTFLCVLVAILS
ncbi:MAG: hypothetical protein KAU17_15315 [Spirochaetales bacterium]|jgi:hypothetical protein|nr:hypothetical protein [Spirochaetales bacterium]